MEIGQKYKVSYNDGNYTLIASGNLISEDIHLICIDDYKDGKVYIGKKYINRMREIGNGNKHS